MEVSVCVLTVPMRNGNDTKELKKANPDIVLTVPMRNGNAVYGHERH